MVSEWRLVWQVTIKYADLQFGGGYPTRVVRVATARELRKIVEWARANPHVIGFPYKRVRELIGDEPSCCRHGHGYGGGSATRVKVGWTDCVCGGHFAYICSWAGCDDVRVDPPVFADCDATEAEITDRAVRPQRH